MGPTHTQQHQSLACSTTAVHRQPLAGSAAVAQQLGGQPDSAADPGEEGPTASDFNWLPGPEVSLEMAFMCLGLCTAGPPDSRKGA